jgi:polar amino acid transport system substrate-binding protein
MVNLIKQLGLGNLFILLAVGLISGCSRSSSDTREAENRLVMGLSADYPPFEFKKNGEVVGLDVDVAQAIAKSLGVSLSIQDMDFSALIPSLQSGRIDFAMAGMTVTEERKKNLEFSDTYFTASFSALVDQGSAISKEEEFEGKKVGVQLGSTMEKFAKERARLYPSMRIVSLGKNPMIIQELKSGRIDAMISEEVQAAAFVQANPSLKYFNLKSTGDGYAIAFQKNSLKSSQLRDRFNEALKKLQNSGEIQQIKQKWLGK